MHYYIEISSWNLLESFVTESISPFSFYGKRKYGNYLSRYLSGEKEKANYLILSLEDLGGDFSLIIDERLIDLKLLCPVPGMKKAFTYPKTIYYQKEYVKFRFGTADLMDSLISESKILLEIKCLEKYISDFYIKGKKIIVRPTISKLEDSLSFEEESYIDFDNKYNKIKGAIIGYTRGQYTSSDDTILHLQNNLRDLKNSFGGMNTQIMMSDVFNDNSDLSERIRGSKELYFKTVGMSHSFDVLLDQYKEVINLARLRSEQKKQLYNNNQNKDDLLQEKTDIEYCISRIEKTYNIVEVRKELDSIKALEKANGERVGKSRLYFKKDTEEYERKQQLKNIIEEFEKGNAEYIQLKNRAFQVEQELNDDSNKYDNILSAIFTRISDILNDLIKNAASLTNGGIVDLSHVAFSDSLYLSSNQNDSELCYFNILLKCILNRTTAKLLSEHSVLLILEESAKLFKSMPLSKEDSGQKILNTLREYWSYKNQRADSFNIPEDMPVLQSIMSFFVKPLGFDQIERYMMIKKFSNKAYAFMLWGAWIGFADMPKTFTKVLYQNDDINSLIDNKLEEISLKLN
ncbi:MAG: lantibiotic ABC transporter [Bacteroidaceae bacterium]|nr:lantibiotic ABC transporter [Bacteroidaceae bacterium]